MTELKHTPADTTPADDLTKPWPVDAANDNEAKPETALELLTRLFYDNQISADERDAGEMVACLAGYVMSRPSANGVHGIPIRDKDGKWSTQVLRGQEIKARLEAALAAVRTDPRRRAVTIALVARERDTEWTDSLVDGLSCGLEDLARHFWSAPVKTTVKINGVTLASVGRGNEDATLERLSKAGNDNTIGDDGVRRITESPFARMHARRQLDSDVGINDILYSAGRNYFQNWYYGGLAGIGGIDYSRIGAGGESGPAHMMPRSEFAAHHRGIFRKARAAMGERYRPVVDAIVLEEQTPSDCYERLTGYKDKTSGPVAVKERLNSALRRLATFYGLMRVPDLAA